MPSPPSKLPEWASGGSADIVEPPEAKKDLGWVGGATPDRPPAQYFNWWMNNVYLWVEFFRQFLLHYDLYAFALIDTGLSLVNRGVFFVYWSEADALWIVGGSSSGSDNRWVATSPDGETWTNRKDTETGAMRDIAFDGTTYAIVGDNVNEITTATDPTGTWTNRPIAGGADALYSIVYDATNGLFIAGGDEQRIYTAPDPTGTWTSRRSGHTNKDIRAMAHYNGTTIAVCSDSGTKEILRSTDGTTWSVVSSGQTTLGTNGVAYHESLGLWVCMQTDGGLLISDDDGATWSAVSNSVTGLSAGPQGNGLKYDGRGALVAACGSSGVFFCEDPENDPWVQSPVPTGESINALGLKRDPSGNAPGNWYWLLGVSSGVSGDNKICKGQPVLY